MLGRMIDKWKWVVGVLLSAANLTILVLGITGNWRDKIVINDLLLQGAIQSIGEIKTSSQQAAAASQKTATDVEVLKSNYSTTEKSLQDIKDEQRRLRERLDEYGDRLGVVEQRQRR